jgi:O-antigen biosynthesis protein WbqP
MKIKFKTIFDFFFSFFLLIIFFPIIFLPVSIAIKISSKGSIFFRQKRIGKDKTKFFLLKFRSMYIDAPSDTPTHEFTNPKKWITPIGRFLRKTSIDELPQLFNILKGDMTFVGPRPALWNQSDLIEERDKYNVNQLKPGLTGWAQINGRDTLPISVKAKLDGEYLKRQSFWFDIYIIFRTALKIFKDDTLVEGGTGKLGKDE